jgi:putative PIN family toxin of toxin-antitoxin system
MQPIVLDTNVVLDLYVYSDPRYAAIHKGLQGGCLVWHATRGMRAELAAVLCYPQIARRLIKNQQAASDVLATMDAQVTWCDTAPKSPFTCKDKDDQMFIDLASQLQCPLISKDKAVLAMRSRLARIGATVAHLYTPSS